MARKGMRQTPFHQRPTGELVGDDRPIPMTDGSTNVGYDYARSRPGMSQEDMKSKGYTHRGKIGGSTRSDLPDFA